MTFKDYYATLEVTIDASPAEVKKAYRSLARKHHPDKNGNDAKATVFFQEIQAAYEVLSNPTKRKNYDVELKHSEQYSSFAKGQIVNAGQILKQSQDLYTYIRTLEKSSVNNDALADYVLALLNKNNIGVLLRTNDTDINDQITSNLLLACQAIIAPRLFNEIAEQLFLLQPNQNTRLFLQIKNELAMRQAKEKQNKLVPYAAIAIVILVIILMCLILFLK